MPEANSAREEILAHIRSSNPPDNDDTRLIQEWMAIRRPFRRKGQLDPEDRLQLFEDRLNDYGAGVHHAISQTELPPVIAAAIQARGKRKMLVPPEFPQAWLRYVLCVPTKSLSLCPKPWRSCTRWAHGL